MYDIYYFLSQVYYKISTMKFTIFAVVIACVALMATANPVPGLLEFIS